MMTKPGNVQIDRTSQETKGLWLKMFVQPLLFLVAGGALIAGLGAAQRAGWISSGGGSPSDSVASVEQIFTCSMCPQIRQPMPGRCPICGMELVVAVSGGGDTDELAVHIEPAGRRLANIGTATARKSVVQRKVRTVGALAYNEGELATIAAYVEGRVERLFADYTGVVVKKGDGLALLYSPELYAAQVEFVQSKSAFKRSSQTQSRMGDLQRELYRSARQKLIELGMTEQQVQQLDETGEAQSRIQIGAPIGGTVIEKLAVEGQYVKTGEPIYRIADLSTVWLMLELFPKDAACVRFGQRVEAEVDSIPGEKFSGRVEFVNPVVNPKTRTVGIRVVILNEEGLLRPGDYATATIDVDLFPTGKAARDEIYDQQLAGKWIGPRHLRIVRDGPGKCDVCSMDLVPASQFGFADHPLDVPGVLLVPRGAVLMAGGNSVVYVETEPGRFEIRPVVLGPFADDQVVILKGLEEGDEVATSGNFLIDSQMQLAGKPSVIDPRRAMVEEAVVKKEGPLDLDQFEVASIAGRTGADLEQLYQAYFLVQASLAGDAAIEPPVSEAIATAAQSLLGAADLPDELRPLVQGIANSAEHLHECDIEQAREDFKAISKAAIQLAARARGVGATGEFIHFYCPMVKGGEGDWLQPSEPLLNPYWGSKMLHCGREVRRLPVAQSADERLDSQTNATPAHPSTTGTASGGVSNRVTFK